MGSKNDNRFVFGLCLDKERDKVLINFLNSKANKSEYIRSVLYEKINSLNRTPNSIDAESLVGVFSAIVNSIPMLNQSAMLNQNSQHAPNINSINNSVENENLSINDNIKEQDVDDIVTDLSDDDKYDNNDMSFNEEDSSCFDNALRSFETMLG